MKKPLIIAGFAGIGKTTLANKYKNVIDLESSIYRWDNTGLEDIPVEARKGMKRKENAKWPNNYIEEIKKQSLYYDIILVWIHPDVLKIYDENNIDYVLCYPNKDSLKIYEQRYKERGNNEEYIERVINTYDMRLNQFKEKNVSQIILKGNETLEDYLLNHNYKLVKRD